MACLNTFMYTSSESDEATHCTDSENVIKCPLFYCTDDRKKCKIYLVFVLGFFFPCATYKCFNKSPNVYENVDAIS